MSQKQIIDLTTPRPRATVDFSLRQYEGSAYSKEMMCWLISPLGSMRFNLNLATKRGINLLFNLSPLTPDCTSCRIDIIINGRIYLEKWDRMNERSSGFNCHAWHIPHLMLQPGNNDIVLKLHDGALLNSAGIHMFTLQNQQQQYWCWSAVATSISKYYDPASGFTQCNLVNSIFNKNDCCQKDKDNTKDCNKPYLISKALIKTGNFGLLIMEKDERKKNDEYLKMIHDQANEGKPIAVSVSFGFAGHVVVVAGIGIDDMIAVDDPWSGPSYLKFEDFKNNYEGYGKWSSCCLTTEVK